jgi:hypothetical protein
MEQAAEQMRAAGQSQGQRGGESRAGQAGGQSGSDASSSTTRTRAQEDAARALDRAADAMAAAGAPADQESRRLSERLASVQDARDRIEQLGREMERLNRQAGQTPGGAGTVPQDIEREMARARELLEQLRREGDDQSQAGRGLTFENQGMVLSAPGTEAFKQDFARWEDLKRQATQALDQAQSTLARKLAERLSRDRLAAGVEDRAPDAYQQQVDSYFKAIAGSKR